MRIVVKEWQFSDGSHSMNNFRLTPQYSLNGSPQVVSKTGRKLNITVVEGKNLPAKDTSGKTEPYVKLQYGKVGHIICLLQILTAWCLYTRTKCLWISFLYLIL